MFAKVYNFKFPGLSEAKVAATFCSEKLGKKIVPFNIRSLNISIGKCGSISINLKFETGEDLNKFEVNSKEFFQDFSILSVQRILKIIGIFSRLYTRDKKSLYLKYIPYAWEILEMRINSAFFSDLRLFLDSNIPKKLRKKIINK